MDLLKKELERKKLALTLAKDKASTSSDRYVKAGDLRRLQEQGEEQLRQKRPRVQLCETTVDKDQLVSQEDETTTIQTPIRIQVLDKNAATASSTTNKTSKLNETALKKSRSDSLSLHNMSPPLVLKELRSLGLPIRLFGETLEKRLQRLQTALEQQTVQSKTQTEMDEFRLGKGHGIRNPFLNRKGEDDDKADAKKKPITGTGETQSSEALAQKEREEEDDATHDPHKKVYRYFKGLLNQWEDDLAFRPDAIKRTVGGKNETKTLKQCKDYIRPLFKQLKSRKLEEGLLHHMIKIVDGCKEGEFVRAHDAYLDLAIGRSAWPIGVTMVGIHARSGRAKIEAANVAHVMNSELHRKYLTSVKRLMTYAQKKAENVDPSKKVLN